MANIAFVERALALAAERRDSNHDDLFRVRLVRAARQLRRFGDVAVLGSLEAALGPAPFLQLASLDLRAACQVFGRRGSNDIGIINGAE